MSRSISNKSYFSRYLLHKGLECPTKLYYKAHGFPEDKSSLPFLKHAGFNKYWLQQLARLGYPQGIAIEERTIEEAAKETQQQLLKENIVLFNALFLHEGLLVKAPILIKKGDQLELIHVQIKGYNPRKHHFKMTNGQLHPKWSQYIIDHAFGGYIIGELYPQWRCNFSIWLPDKTLKSYEGYLLHELKQASPVAKVVEEESLFGKVDVTPLVQSLLDGTAKETFLEGHSFIDALKILANRHFEPEWQSVQVGTKCRSCEFRITIEKKEGAESGFDRCWNRAEKVTGFNLDRPHVFDLIGPGINAWVKEGIYFQDEVPVQSTPGLQAIKRQRSAITHKQRQVMQVLQAKGQEVPEEVIKPPIFEELKRWEYPIHFLDFEAGSYAIPIRKNRRPYHLVVFQFSCHTLQEDGTLTHHQWIAKKPEPYPNYELVRQLMKLPGMQEGTIVQYSNFERHALKTIRRELLDEYKEVADAPALIGWLDAFLRRKDSSHGGPPYLADMNRLVKKYYYNKAMGGSLSIKGVVQSVLTVSKALQKQYSAPYSSTNFDKMQWWQWDASTQEATSPYRLMQQAQPGMGVAGGAEALFAFGKVIAGEMEPSSQKEAIKALLKYCELDTLAMVMIFQHWEHAHKRKLLKQKI